VVATSYRFDSGRRHYHLVAHGFKYYSERVCHTIKPNNFPVIVSDTDLVFPQSHS